MKRVSVLGAGSFGTAVAIAAARQGHEVVLWARREELAKDLRQNGVNEHYLPSIGFPPTLRCTADLEETTQGEVIFVVVPSHGFRESLKNFLKLDHGNKEPLALVSATKGIETETLAQMSRVCFEEGMAADRDVRFAVFSGPSFAAEMAAGKATAAVIGSEDTELAAGLQREFSSRELRLYTSSDVSGVELGGATKNVIAIASGIVDGLGLGLNTRAALITRGLHEITRLGLACGGRPRTFSGLAGLGDLVLTCTGGLSRNLRAGRALAEGISLWDMEKRTGMVAEGLRNSQAIHRLALKQGVEMPITHQMVEVIYEGKDPKQALKDLMERELKAESEL